ncbi:alpha/beta fold hydrolase [Phytoactinopolyspora halotolerans]|uniref:Alpha/beta hydrolase n=1 Tax=Phytoactinopolyspora halotolerans TaxID=1981512 RepID=A0A6L9SDR5_9ACTN|nr:alpha/beta hydrolase [Phytoactinopolyspora halotolerans]NEE02661.1 alpha/beta hydrolase [Phytoactinopolyspora halotolerans]
MADTQFLQRPEGRLAYDVQGDGPLVLCAPGMMDLRGVYRNTVPALVAAGYRVATMDLRGHGDSDATFAAYDDPAAGADLLALVEHLGGGPAVLVGNSMGGAAAVWAAAERPESVRGLVLLGAFVRGPFAPWYKKALTAVLLRRPWGVPATGAAYRSFNAGQRPADLDDHIARITSALRRPGAWSAFLATSKTSHAPVTPRLGSVQAPTLVVMGEIDPDFSDPAAEARFTADAIGGDADVLMVPDAGHYPQAQRPDLVNPAITSFLSKLGEAADA